jgi:8-oxo-dGTP pyrophosphatase MutT (NUDIX family)
MTPFELSLPTLKAALISCLDKKLPGKEAQLLMAPAYRRKSIMEQSIPDNAVLSSVLILLYDREDEIYLVFIKRAEYEGVHSAQISFPGGKVEPEDINFSFTAIRESKEEIGIIPSNIEVIGALSPLFIPPSNFIVYPFIGVIESSPLFVPDPVEVQGIIEIPLNHFFRPENKTEHEIIRIDGKLYPVPGFTFKDHFIWGATAMILSEFLAVLMHINE